MIKGLNIGEKIISIDADKGYKISCFIENVKACNPYAINDVTKCMKTLREFHSLKIKTKYTFDIFKHIQSYEYLWKKYKKTSYYENYEDIKEKVFRLKPFLEEKDKDNWCLSHIDAVPDNFLIKNNKDVFLIDWEYAAMCNPNIDIAMFVLYAGYDEKDIDRLIDIYYPEGCGEDVRLRILGYIATGGLLWSNWCEYKSIFGMKFGEYAQNQFEFARKFSIMISSLLN